MKMLHVIGNWKMHKTEKEAMQFIEELAPLISSFSVKVYLAVPFTAISASAKTASKTSILIGAQNMNDAQKGAFTGEIAASMLKAAGAEFVLLGHSERRHIFKETDEFINSKLLRALKEDLIPILCVGETEKEREENKTEEVLIRQLHEGLKNVDSLEKIMIAYEPVWAIGTGKTATVQIAEKAHKFIRAYLKDVFKTNIHVPILYGGSVKPENIAELVKEDDIDGALVGGASLDPKVFYKIIENC
jgi:triosephosphate isomerase